MCIREYVGRYLVSRMHHHGTLRMEMCRNISHVNRSSFRRHRISNSSVYLSVAYTSSPFAPSFVRVFIPPSLLSSVLKITLSRNGTQPSSHASPRDTPPSQLYCLCLVLGGSFQEPTSLGRTHTYLTYMSLGEIPQPCLQTPRLLNPTWHKLSDASVHMCVIAASAGYLCSLSLAP